VEALTTKSGSYLLEIAISNGSLEQGYFVPVNPKQDCEEALEGGTNQRRIFVFPFEGTLSFK
jgi:hypothetical protein